MEAIPVMFHRNPRDLLWYAKESEKTAILKTLPSDIRDKIQNISPGLKVTSDGSIQYPDGEIGSSLVEMSNWLENKTEKPIDADKFNRLIYKKKLHYPKYWTHLYS